MRKYALAFVAVLAFGSFAKAQDCGSILTATPVVVNQPAFFSAAVVNPFVSVRVAQPVFVQRRAVVVNPVFVQRAVVVNRAVVVRPAVRVNVVGGRAANVRVRVR